MVIAGGMLSLNVSNECISALYLSVLFNQVTQAFASPHPRFRGRDSGTFAPAFVVFDRAEHPGV